MFNPPNHPWFNKSKRASIRLMFKYHNSEVYCHAGNGVVTYGILVCEAPRLVSFIHLNYCLCVMEPWATAIKALCWFWRFLANGHLPQVSRQSTNNCVNEVTLEARH